MIPLGCQDSPSHCNSRMFHAYCNRKCNIMTGAVAPVWITSAPARGGVQGNIGLLNALGAVLGTANDVC